MANPALEQICHLLYTRPAFWRRTVPVIPVLPGVTNAIPPGIGYSPSMEKTDPDIIIDLNHTYDGGLFGKTEVDVWLDRPRIPLTRDERKQLSLAVHTCLAAQLRINAPPLIIGTMLNEERLTQMTPGERVAFMREIGRMVRPWNGVAADYLEAHEEDHEQS